MFRIYAALRVLTQCTTSLKGGMSDRAPLRFPHLSFIRLEPYPARYARHLPHAGKAFDYGATVFPISLYLRGWLGAWGKGDSRFAAFYMYVGQRFFRIVRRQIKNRPANDCRTVFMMLGKH